MKDVTQLRSLQVFLKTTSADSEYQSLTFSSLRNLSHQSTDLRYLEISRLKTLWGISSTNVNFTNIKFSDRSQKRVNKKIGINFRVV